MGELKLTTISLQLTDRLVKYWIGILGDVLVKVGKFNILEDLVVLEM